MLARLTGHTLRLNSPKRYVFVCTGYIAAALELLEGQPPTQDYAACNLAYKRAERLGVELAEVQARAQHIKGLSEEDHVIGMAGTAIVQHVSDILLHDLTRAGAGARCSLRPETDVSVDGAEDQSDAGALCHICTERFLSSRAEADACPDCGRADMCVECVGRIYACPWCRSTSVGRASPPPPPGEQPLPPEFLLGLQEIDIHIRR